jgi:hypothetical protein
MIDMNENYFWALLFFVIITIRGYQMWKRFDRGEIENIVSTFEESYKTNKKIFGSKPIVARSVINNHGESWKLKSTMDVMKILESEHPCDGIVYFEDSNEDGIHLVFTIREQNNDEIMTISAMNGTSVIAQGEFNMDHESPAGVFKIINALFEERSKKEELDNLFSN